MDSSMDDENEFIDQDPDMAAEAASDAERDAELDAVLEPDADSHEVGEHMQTEPALRPEDEAAHQVYADDALVDLESVLKDTNDKLLRALADAENTRRIAAREKADAAKYAIANFARDLVGVADNLGMALQSVDGDVRKADPALDNLCVGIEMTQKELAAAFERNGIKAVDALGQPFDHNFHEALQKIPSPDVPEGQVVQVIRGGYRIHDRLLRAAQVLVATGGPKAAAPESAETPVANQTGEGQTAYEGGGAQPGGTVDEET